MIKDAALMHREISDERRVMNLTPYVFYVLLVNACRIEGGSVNRVQAKSGEGERSASHEPPRPAKSQSQY